MSKVSKKKLDLVKNVPSPSPSAPPAQFTRVYDVVLKRTNNPLIALVSANWWKSAESRPTHPNQA